MKAFNQPSMVWYYVNWKDEVYKETGLRTHFKILPDIPWFKKSVEAGRKEIFTQYPDHPTLNILDVRYAGSLTEALEALPENH